MYAGISSIRVDASCSRSGITSAPKKVRWSISGQYFRAENLALGEPGFVSGLQGDYLHVKGKWRAAEGRAIYAQQPFYVPGLILVRSLDPTHYLATVTTQQSGQDIEISVRDLSHSDYGDFAEQHWFFDSGSGLPTHVTYQIPTTSNPHRSVPTTWWFSSFMSFQGLALPGKLRQDIDGGSESTCVIESLDTTPLSADLFTIPQGGGQ